MKANANGFTLVEVMVATVVLAVGMLAMAASTGYISSEIRNSSWNTQRALAREQVVEQLRATPFDNIVTNSSGAVVGRYSMTWVVASVNTNLKTVRVISSGPAYRVGQGAKSTVVDTVTVQVSRP